MAIRGRGTKLGRGRGRNQPEPSPGVRNDQNKRQKLGIDDASKQKYNYTSDSEDTNEYYPSNDIDDARDNHQAAITNNVKKCKGVSFEISNNLRQSSGRIRNGQGRGRSDLPESSQPCTGSALPPPPHTSFSASDAYNVKKGKGVSFGFSASDVCTSPTPPPPHVTFSTAKRYATYGMRQGLDDDQEIISPFNRKRGIRNGQGKGRSDPPEPSQSCTSPPPHTSFSPE